MEKIGILGIGKLGICFALNLERSGYEVLGVDVDQDYVNKINEKTLVSHEPLVEDYLKASKSLTATVDLSDVVNSDCRLIFVAVATPSTPDGRYDHYQVDRVVENIIDLGRQSEKRHIAVVCTTMPGYCDEIAEKLKPFNYTVSYNPEFIAQGNIIKDLQQPDQVLIGEGDQEAGDLIEAVYRKVCENEPVFCRMKPLSAEICKIATNCFLTTKISFANSIGDLAIKAGAEPDKILEAIGADSRIGGKYLRYGFGFGGPCFPRDNRALGIFAEDEGYELLISKATDEVNQRHLDFQFQQWMQQYREDETIIFDHVSYKKGSVLIEESQQLALAVKLAKAGRKVLIKDHPAVIEQVRQLHGDLFEYQLE